MAHKNSNPTMSGLIEFAVDLSIKNLNSVKHKFTTAAVARGSKVSKAADGRLSETETSQTRASETKTRYIPAAIEHYIWVRDRGCYHIHSLGYEACNIPLNRN
jgi:hypothetical protein